MSKRLQVQETNQHLETCPTCDGEGRVSVMSTRYDCQECGGSGLVRIDGREALLVPEFERVNVA